MNLAAGDLDRRVTVEVCEDVRDGSGDVVRRWPPAAGSFFKRWAARKSLAPGRAVERVGSEEVVRQVDTVFVVRDDSQSRLIAPETHRIRYQGRVYEIVGIDEANNARADGRQILCASRPDRRGDRGVGDGQP